MNNRIRDLREDHDLTQQQIADVIGITQRKYSYLETGKQQLTEPHPVKRTEKKYKISPVSSRALLAVFYAAKRSRRAKRRKGSAMARRGMSRWKSRRTSGR